MPDTSFVCPAATDSAVPARLFAYVCAVTSHLGMAIFTGNNGERERAEETARN